MKKIALLLDFLIKANGKNSSVFGNQYKVTGEASGAFGVGKGTWNNTTNRI